VHYLLIPTTDAALINPKVEQAVARMQSVVELGRAAREKRGIGLKRPLRRVTVVHTDKAVLDDVAVGVWVLCCDVI
jgi:isoleucyl-tRNA synthetase